MNQNHTIKLRILLPLCLLIAIFGAGCSGNGYITSSVSTGIGLDVSENPKTQVPHVKFGYLRNQLYYVPTGKTAGANGVTGLASDTPDLVSEIFVNSKFLQGMTISEKFAIGKAAVASDASTTAFATSPAQQLAASVPASAATNNATVAAELMKAATAGIPKRSGVVSTGNSGSRPPEITGFDERKGAVTKKLSKASPAKLKAITEGNFDTSDPAAVKNARRAKSDEVYTLPDTEEGRRKLREIEDALELPE